VAKLPPARLGMASWRRSFCSLTAVCQLCLFGHRPSTGLPARSVGVAATQSNQRSVGRVIAGGTLLLSVQAGRSSTHGADSGSLRDASAPRDLAASLQSGRIVGRVLNIVDEKPVRGAKIEVLRQRVDRLPDGSYLIHSIDESVPLGITAYTDEAGRFVVTVPLLSPPNYFVVVVQAAGYHKIEQMLTLVVPDKPTSTEFDLIPTRPTREQLEVIQKKLELRRRRLVMPEVTKQP